MLYPSEENAPVDKSGQSLSETTPSLVRDTTVPLQERYLAFKEDARERHLMQLRGKAMLHHLAWLYTPKPTQSYVQDVIAALEQPST